MTIEIEVACQNGHAVYMRLNTDVEGSNEGEYECPVCKSKVNVTLRVGNEH